jgi:hypothetical protein
MSDLNPKPKTLNTDIFEKNDQDWHRFYSDILEWAFLSNSGPCLSEFIYDCVTGLFVMEM